MAVALVDIMTLNGDRSMLGAPDITALRSGLRGAVLLSGDEGYETARRVWNGNVDRHPSVIVRCMGASDVQRAVDFARKRDLLTWQTPTHLCTVSWRPPTLVT